MEFPNDIWIEIMGYFHSTYKKPLHYECLLENDYFYFSRETNKTLACISERLKGRFHLEMGKLYNSFYMKLILFSTKVTNICLKRQTAAPNILGDFKVIFDEYKSSNVQLLNDVKYVQ